MKFLFFFLTVLLPFASGPLFAQSGGENVFRIKKDADKSKTDTSYLAYPLTSNTPDFMGTEEMREIVPLIDSISLDDAGKLTVGQLLGLSPADKVVSVSTRIQYHGKVYTRSVLSGTDWSSFQASFKKEVVLSFDEVVVQKGLSKHTVYYPLKTFVIR